MQRGFNRIIRNITLVSIIVITPYNCGHSSVFAACIISEDDIKKKKKKLILEVSFHKMSLKSLTF